MTYVDPNNPARVPTTDDPARPPSGVPDPGGMSVWAFPLIVATALVILGFVFFGPHGRTTTASNNPPATSGQTTPAPAPAAPSAPKQ